MGADTKGLYHVIYRRFNALAWEERDAFMGGDDKESSDKALH